MFNDVDPPDPAERRTFLLPDHQRALGFLFMFSRQAPDDLETDAERTANGLPTRPGFACAMNSNAAPPMFIADFMGATLFRNPGGNESLYVLLSTQTPDVEVARVMHCTEEITGTVSVTLGSKNVTGVGTQFTSELATGTSKNAVLESRVVEINMRLTQSQTIQH